MVVAGRERNMHGPLSHRLGPGNSHFLHILLAKANSKANPDSKGRKTNSPSSVEELQSHLQEGEDTERDETWGQFTISQLYRYELIRKSVWFFF